MLQSLCADFPKLLSLVRTMEQQPNSEFAAVYDETGARSRARVGCVLGTLSALLLFVGSSAAQPRPAPTPLPQNPNWCADVPASPPPPEFRAPRWALIWKTCSTGIGDFENCLQACEAAREQCERWREGGRVRSPFNT